MRLLIVSGCLWLLSLGASAQTLFGTVLNDHEERLYGATVRWEGAADGVVTDENGTFTLPHQSELTNLLVDYVGYNTVEIPVRPGEDSLWIEISGIYELVTVEVAARLYDNYTSTLAPRNVEHISSNELKKAACCNLSESFQTNASVDVSYADAITGAKEIQLLGLRGSYTQMTIEKRPSMGGLGSAFALEYLPGTWLHGIQIVKGAGSVQHGYQSITGQINTELVKPFEDDRLFVNLYASSFNRQEVNLHFNQRWNDEWSSGLLLHASRRDSDRDKNEDGFYDLNKKELFSGLWRNFYRGDIIRSQFNVHYVTDRHVGGQIIPEGAVAADFYQIAQNNERVEFFAKMGYLGFEDDNTSLGLIGNASRHVLRSNYGSTAHRGEQTNAYFNSILATAGNDPRHLWNVGASFLYDRYDEFYGETDVSRTEIVPGVFGEYTFKPETTDAQRPTSDEENWKNKIGVVAGLRLDYHNLAGYLVTPRLNVKYNFTPDHVIRVSAGRGYRRANVIAENLGVLASNKRIEIAPDLRMEDAWNYGINYTQRFNIGAREASWSADLYRTWFNNQIVLDRQTTTDVISFYNLDGESFSNSLLSVFSWNVLRDWEVKLAYKYNDVRMTLRDGDLRQAPLVPKHRGLITLDYETPNEKWNVNTNVQLVGRQIFPAGPRAGTASPAYALLNGQISYDLGQWEIYLGGENLTSYVQANPIIDWENPFGENFDATQVFAPINGAMGYVGLRFGIE